MVLLLSQVLALCITGTNTLTTLLVIEGTSIPAFQTFFNYVLLNLIYTPFTVYRYGWNAWVRLILKDGWKCEFSLAGGACRTLALFLFAKSFVHCSTFPLSSRLPFGLCEPTRYHAKAVE